MQRFLYLAFMTLITAVQVNAQGVQISFDATTAENEIQNYGIDNYTLNITDQYIDVKNSDLYLNGYESLTISQEGLLVGVLADEGEHDARVLSFDGNQILALEDDILTPDDPSEKIYVLANGKTIIRSNISNFGFYSPTGEYLYTISNNTGSSEGETISKLAYDPMGRTIVLYNPKILGSGKSSSRVTYVSQEGNKELIFNENSRTIKYLNVSENGAFIGIVTESPGTKDQVVVIDKFGNEYIRTTSDEDLKGIHFSEGNSHITVYSGGRMAVYNVSSQERVGSSSIRGASLLYANYIPEDNILLGLAGQYNSDTDLITETEVKAVDFNRRKISSGSISTPLSRTENIPIGIKRISAQSYLLTGLNKHLKIKPTF